MATYLAAMTVSATGISWSLLWKRTGLARDDDDDDFTGMTHMRCPVQGRSPTKSVSYMCAKAFWALLSMSGMLNLALGLTVRRMVFVGKGAERA
jgi:hypothetical protein